MKKYLTEFVKMVIVEKAAASHAAKGRAMEKACEELGIEISSVKCYGKESKRGEHCRVFLSSGDAYGREDMARDIVSNAFSVDVISVKNVGKTHSGTRETLQVVDSTGAVHDILFSGGLTTGARGGGYAYEEELKNSFKSVNVKAEEGLVDTTKTDIFVKTASDKPVNIEVKAEGAKFGQPTLQYAYATREFSAPKAKSPETAQPVLEILNAEKDNVLLLDWLSSLKGAWDELHPHDEMEVFDKQVQVQDWDAMKVIGSFKTRGPKIEIDPSTIVRYYLKKGAHYIQFRGKGMYSFDDVLNLGVPSFLDSVSGAHIVPEILTSSGNKVIRATLEVKGLMKSEWDLDKEDSLQAFAIALSEN